MFYSSDAEVTRAFLRDVLELPVADVGGGWLIAQAPAAEIGCHLDASDHGRPPGTQSISFTCSDLDAMTTTLRSRGVDSFSDVNDFGYGRTTTFRMPGDVKVELYQPGYTLDFS